MATTARRICRGWRFSEEQFVREHYRTMPMAEIAAKLGRSVWAVKHVARRLNIVGENHAPYRWSASRRRRFCDAYQQSPESAARQFGLTRMSANSYASRFGALVRRPWSADEDELVRSMWPKYGDAELCTLLNRTPDSIRCRAWKLGLRRKSTYKWKHLVFGAGWRFAS